MQKITHVNFAFGFRGGERQTLNLILGLANHGFSQKLIVRENSALIARTQNINKLEIIAISKPYLKAIKHLNQDDIVHAHESKAGYFALISHLIKNTPYIVTRRLDKKINNTFINRLIYNKANCIVALSEAILTRIKQLSPHTTTTVIHDSYTEYELNATKIKKLRARFEGKFVVGNIANIEKLKGQAYIVEAAKKLNDKYADMVFLFLGEGEDKQKLERATRDYKNIFFEGFVDNVGDYLSVFDLFVFPTLFEGFGSSIVDAMRFNVPVIASNTGGIPDIIQNQQGGILVDISQLDSLDQFIENIYLNKQLRLELIKNNNEILTRYSVEKIVDQHKTIYKKIKNQENFKAFFSDI